MSEDLCQNCGLRPASVFYAETVQVNQKVGKRELRLCETCAKQKGVALSSFPAVIQVPDLLKAFLEPAGRIALPAPGPQCLSCGITWQQVRQTGFLGCPRCYEIFASLLRPVLQRIQRGSRHTGRRAEGEIPPRQKQRKKEPGAARPAESAGAERARLKKELSEAIQREDYEKAAKLRDRIRTLPPPRSGKTVSESSEPPPARRKSQT